MKSKSGKDVICDSINTEWQIKLKKILLSNSRFGDYYSLIKENNEIKIE